MYALMPVKNESGRWLSDTLAHLERLEVPVLVCDDASEDDTRDVATSFSNVVLRERPDNVPTFLEHEGYFRQWCWECLDELQPTVEDWILAIDADEFLVGPEDIFNPFLHTGGRYKTSISAWGLTVAEVWGFDDDGTPLIRKDRFWALNEQGRLAKWQPDPTFPDRKMASGSLPLYARDGVTHTPYLTILHYGYALPHDRRLKHQRYAEHSEGHNPEHIESILMPPTLARWDGAVPTLNPRNS